MQNWIPNTLWRTGLISLLLLVHQDGMMVIANYNFSSISRCHLFMYASVYYIILGGYQKQLTTGFIWKSYL